MDEKASRSRSGGSGFELLKKVGSGGSEGSEETGRRRSDPNVNRTVTPFPAEDENTSRIPRSRLERPVNIPSAASSTLRRLLYDVQSQPF